MSLKQMLRMRKSVRMFRSMEPFASEDFWRRADSDLRNLILDLAKRHSERNRKRRLP